MRCTACAHVPFEPRRILSMILVIELGCAHSERNGCDASSISAEPAAAAAAAAAASSGKNRR